MELNDFVKAFVELFDDTDASVITTATSFQDLDEWSSLTAMQLIALAKLQFNKTVTGKEIRSCETVEDLFNLFSK